MRAPRALLASLWGGIVRFWRVVSRPSTHLSLGFLTLGGFVCGVIFWGGFNTTLEATNTEKFCVSCHEMHDNVYQELMQTVHYSNRSGVRATCPDCHVPHNWTDKIARKMQASKEVWGKIFGKIFGTISTRPKFLAYRLELAEHEQGAEKGVSFGGLRRRTSFWGRSRPAGTEDGRRQLRGAGWGRPGHRALPIMGSRLRAVWAGARDRKRPSPG